MAGWRPCGGGRPWALGRPHTGNRKIDVLLCGTRNIEQAFGETMSTLIVAHYDEIALKGRRRHLFEKRLAENVRDALSAWGRPAVRRLGDRLLIGPVAETAYPEVAGRMGSTPGVAWFARVAQLAAKAESLDQIADRVAAEVQKPRSFQVRARRADKEFPLKSLEIERQLGRLIQQRTNWPVDLENADLTVHVDVTRHGILTYHDRQPGLGGLPVGSTGKLVCLLSGGIDSPVAAFKMICRGCQVVFAHFHNYTPDNAAVRRKIVCLVEHFQRFQPVSRLYLVPFARIQADLIAAVPARMRMVAYRRAMLRLAGPILEKEDARGFIVGDSLGQVASQTLENLQATYPASRYPVFAPLIGESKRAIVDLARQIGTFETSVLPYDDCCQRLVASSPETRCSVDQMAACEEKLPLDDYLQQVEGETEVVQFRQADARRDSALAEPAD